MSFVKAICQSETRSPLFSSERKNALARARARGRLVSRVHPSWSSWHPIPARLGRIDRSIIVQRSDTIRRTGRRLIDF